MAQVAVNADVYASSRVGIFFPANNQTPEDGNLTGQCVTLNKWFLAEMTDVPSPFSARGDARYAGDRLVAQGHAIEVPYKDRKRGDFVVYKYGLYGHIGVLLSDDRLFEQNVNAGGAERRLITEGNDSWFVYAARIGKLSESWRPVQPNIYRIKSYKEVIKPTPPKEDEMVTLNGLKVLYKFYLGTGVSEYGMKNRLGKQTFDEAQHGIMNSAAMKDKINNVKNNQTGLIKHLPSTLQAVVKLPEQTK